MEHEREKRIRGAQAVGIGGCDAEGSGNGRCGLRRGFAAVVRRDSRLACGLLEAEAAAGGRAAGSRGGFAAGVAGCERGFGAGAAGCSRRRQFTVSP
jgi:hypothetical protein